MLDWLAWLVFWIVQYLQEPSTANVIALLALVAGIVSIVIGQSARKRRRRMIISLIVSICLIMVGHIFAVASRVSANMRLCVGCGPIITPQITATAHPPRLPTRTPVVEYTGEPIANSGSAPIPSAEPIFEDMMIDASRGWQLMTINAPKGSTVTVRPSTGEWGARVGSGPELPDILVPAGGAGYSIRYPEVDPSADHPFGAMLAQVDGHPIMALTTSMTYESPGIHQIRFRINDSDQGLEDNAGFISVLVEITP